MTVLLVACAGCGDKKQRARIASLDSAVLTELIGNYPPNSRSAVLIKQELERRGVPDDPQPVHERARVNSLPVQPAVAESKQESSPRPIPQLEPTVEDRLLEIIALQKAIDVPHELEDGSARVVRIEPDGISVRHSSGIRKIAMEKMQEPLREKYHIREGTAHLYRKWVEQRRAEARLVYAKGAVRRQAEMKEMYAAQERESQEKANKKAQADRASARLQWARYDEDMREYRRRCDRADYNQRVVTRDYNGNIIGRSRRIATSPKRPKMPSVPRP